jgi:hypothetical protein
LYWPDKNVMMIGGCADNTTRPYRYAWSLRRWPSFLVPAAQSPNILTVYIYVVVNLITLQLFDTK